MFSELVGFEVRKLLCVVVSLGLAAQQAPLGSLQREF